MENERRSRTNTKFTLFNFLLKKIISTHLFYEEKERNKKYFINNFFSNFSKSIQFIEHVVTFSILIIAYFMNAKLLKLSNKSNNITSIETLFNACYRIPKKT